MINAECIMQKPTCMTHLALCIWHSAFPMISFGELRKKSVEWQTEISAVEKIYARDWLLKGMFDRDALRDKLILRGASALASAYFSDYPRIEDIDFARENSLDDATLEREIENAVSDATRASGLQFRLNTFQSSEARVEFTGPLGRRSAAQPLIVARFVSTMPRSEPSTRALLHPFIDTCEATVRAVSLNELAAERIVLYSQKPRARDVYDLWFILTRGASGLDNEQTHVLAQTRAREKNLALRATLDDQYAPLLERAWENVLKEIRPRPSFAQARAEIEAQLRTLLG